jgi:hypothetical protein
MLWQGAGVLCFQQKWRGTCQKDGCVGMRVRVGPSELYNQILPSPNQ